MPCGDWLATAVAGTNGSRVIAPSRHDVPNRDLVHLDATGAGFDAPTGVTLLDERDSPPN